MHSAYAFCLFIIVKVNDIPENALISLEVSNALISLEVSSVVRWRFMKIHLRYCFPLAATSFLATMKRCWSSDGLPKKRVRKGGPR